MTEQDEHLSRWARAVKNRAKSMLNAHDDTVAWRLTNAINQLLTPPHYAPIDVRLVNAWLNGVRAPQDIIYHMAIMHALQLPGTDVDSSFHVPWEPIQSSSELLIKCRNDLDYDYANIPNGLKTDDPATLPPNMGSKGNGAASHAAKTRTKGDGRAQTADGIPNLEHLTQAKRAEVLSKITEPSTIIKAVRLAKGWSQHAMVAQMGTDTKRDGHQTISHIETGLGDPDAKTLARLKCAFTKAHLEDCYPRLEELVIDRNLQKYPTMTSRHIDILSPVYWAAVLNRFHHPEQWEAIANKPIWANKMLVELTKNDYMYAIRNALGLHETEVSAAGKEHEIIKSPSTIKDFEAGRLNDTQIKNTEQSLIRIYGDGFATEKAIELAKNSEIRVQPSEFPDPVFDADKYSNLPIKITEDKRDKSHRARVPHTIGTTHETGALASI